MDIGAQQANETWGRLPRGARFGGNPLRDDGQPPEPDCERVGADDAAQLIAAWSVIAGVPGSVTIGWELEALDGAPANTNRSELDEKEVLASDVLDRTPDADALWPDELVELSEARSLLVRVLDTLRQASREVFVLYELNGLSLKEIHEQLGIPAGTVASRLRRARQKVARELETLGCFGGQPWRHSGRRWRAI